jgi:FHA domain-containing protein
MGPTPSSGGPARPARRWTLVIEGAGGVRAERALEHDSYLIGRDPDCSLCLPVREVSKRHALLERDDEGQWWLNDQNSSSGTFVNGKRCTEPVLVLVDDVIHVGGHRLELRTDQPPPSRRRLLPPENERSLPSPARLQIYDGPLAGREVRLDRGVVRLGTVPNATVPMGKGVPGVIEVLVRPLPGGDFEVDDLSPSPSLRWNGEAVRQGRLRAGGYDVVLLLGPLGAEPVLTVRYLPSERVEGEVTPIPSSKGVPGMVQREASRDLPEPLPAAKESDNELPTMPPPAMSPTLDAAFDDAFDFEHAEATGPAGALTPRRMREFTAPTPVFGVKSPRARTSPRAEAPKVEAPKAEAPKAEASPLIKTLLAVEPTPKRAGSEPEVIVLETPVEMPSWSKGGARRGAATEGGSVPVEAPVPDSAPPTTPGPLMGPTTAASAAARADTAPVAINAAFAATGGRGAATAAAPSASGANPGVTSHARAATGASPAATDARRPATDAHRPATGGVPAATGASRGATGLSPAATGAGRAATSGPGAATGASPVATSRPGAATGASPVATSRPGAATSGVSAATGASPAATGASPAATGASPAATGASPVATSRPGAATGASPAATSGIPAAPAGVPAAPAGVLTATGAGPAVRAGVLTATGAGPAVRAGVLTATGAGPAVKAGVLTATGAGLGAPAGASAATSPVAAARNGAPAAASAVPAAIDAAWGAANAAPTRVDMTPMIVDAAAGPGNAMAAGLAGTALPAEERLSAVPARSSMVAASVAADGALVLIVPPLWRRIGLAVGVVGGIGLLFAWLVPWATRPPEVTAARPAASATAPVATAPPTPSPTAPAATAPPTPAVPVATAPPAVPVETAVPSPLPTRTGRGRGGAAPASTPKTPTTAPAPTTKPPTGAPDEGERDTNAEDDAREALRRRLEAKADAGKASREELRQLLSLCLRRHDAACVAQTQSRLANQTENP